MWMALPTPPAPPPMTQPLVMEMPPLPKNAHKNRIVQALEKKKSKTAVKDAFLGKQNQTVEKQTVSTSSRSAKSSTQAPSTVSRPAKPSLSRFGVPLFRAGMFAPDRDEKKWATPGTRPEDYVKGMTEAGRTALNTKEFIFYGYFQRIRDQLDRAWVPILRRRLSTYFRTGRHLASDMDHTTRVFVVMNDLGEVVRVQIQGRSGVQDLDEAAIAAFNQAGPFPNPPRGMVDTNREVKISWDFILKT